MGVTGNQNVLMDQWGIEVVVEEDDSSDNSDNGYNNNTRRSGGRGRGISSSGSGSVNNTSRNKKKDISINFLNGGVWIDRISYAIQQSLELLPQLNELSPSAAGAQLIRLFIIDILGKCSVVCGVVWCGVWSGVYYIVIRTLILNIYSPLLLLLHITTITTRY